jgi:glycine cleavage system aminomethyltransferase T/glycine/D-amino acid oxidase-like deaminating enzyme
LSSTRPRAEARVVIVGGGIAGCSVAYHLARKGWTDVVLVDKGELTSGSTWHAAGMVTHFHTSPVLMRMRQYSIGLYRSLQAEPGTAEHWHEVGSLRVASSRDQWRFLQRQVGTARAIGLDVDTISPEEALRFFPLMSGERLYGAMYLPGDGWLDPSGATMELAARARRLGVELRTGVRVTGIARAARGAVAGVETDAGVIRTERVVNAAGMWAGRIAAMVGVHLPITPLLHQHLATKPIAGHQLPRATPCLRDPENLVYMREEVGGLLIGGFERSPVAWSVDGVPWEFTQQLLPSDWELFGEILEGAIRRVPILAKAELAHLVNGPEGITPDSRPLLGPVPGVPGFWVAAGLSHTGFGAGGAIGAIVADWLVDGEPPYDVTELNVRRFGRVYDDRAYAAERARESYRYYYTLRYPHDENELARARRPSPLDARLHAAGAVFGEKNGWERPNYFMPGSPGRRAGADQRRWGWARPAFFDRVGAEHRAVRERVGLFDFTSFGKLDVTGPGATALLQRLADNDVDRPVGSVIYTQLLNPRGGIESDLTVTRWAPDRFRVTTGSNVVASDLGWILMHRLPDDGVEVRDVTDDFACIGLWGPAARQTLQAVSSSDVSNAAFPYMSARRIQVAGVTAEAQRVTYVGELGWELYLPSRHAVVVWDALVDGGRAFGIELVGYKAVDSLRLEKGYRYWSTDLTPTENPYEAGLGFCVRLKKGDFIGRDALVRIAAEGIQRKLCTLTLTEPLPDDSDLYGGEAVHADGRVVGRLRSAGWGYTIAKHIGLVYLPPALATVGTPLAVEAFGARFAAEVASDVLYDPAGARLRS